ncbi:hypothetical protein O9993_14165 [Vibrio lentus]|nr:hypothetical protein [Vibrio lentus]
MSVTCSGRLASIDIMTLDIGHFSMWRYPAKITRQPLPSLFSNQQAYANHC